MTASLRFQRPMTQCLDFTTSSKKGDLAKRPSGDVGGARATIGKRAILLLRQTIVLAVVTSSAFGLGYGAGKLLHDPHAAALAHASGACIALEMAAAHGAIDEVERRLTLRALASALNPHFERFPEQASEISTECGKLIKGADSGKIARGHGLRQ